MKIIQAKFWIFLIFLLSLNLTVKGIDSLKYYFSFNYYKDLSDTYGGGSLLSGEFTACKSWYGASINYGHFQSQSTYTFKITVEGKNESVEIPIEEMAIMQIGALSILLRPIEKRWIETDVILGLALGQAKSSILESVYYNYSFIENKFTYLYRDYQLIKKSHFGYQVGLNISFFISKKVGLQINSRIQDLSNGGTFFFVGTGICFRL